MRKCPSESEMVVRNVEGEQWVEYRDIVGVKKWQR